MTLRDTIRKATAAVVPKLITTELAGSTVDTVRNVQTRDAGGRPVNTATNPLLGAEWFIREIADARVQRVWGVESAAAAEAQVPLETDVAENDVVTVIEGDYIGNSYEIEQLQHDTLGNRILIALAPTGQKPPAPPVP